MKSFRLIVAMMCVSFGFACTAAPARTVSPAGPELQQLVEANNAFALDLYAQLAARDGNVLISPCSISTALAMTYAGAGGNTESEMAEVLHFDMPENRLHAAFDSLLNATRTEADEACRLRLANALWIQRDYPFLDSFTSMIRGQYSGEAADVDFKTAGEAARKRINSWVAENTDQRIRDLLSPDDLSTLTRLVLTNAIWFKGEWLSRFDSSRTKPGDFHRPDGTTGSVPMMHQSGSFPYARHENVQILELPYVGEELSMVVLLPNERHGLPDLEKSLTASRLTEWLNGLRPEGVYVSLPRFKLACRAYLKDALTTLGMVDAFDDQAADFSGMTGDQELFIYKVIHQADIEVDEQGTEAAAATAVVMHRKGNPSFRADHPFLFLIRHNPTGSILFLGRVIDPGGN